MNWKNLFIFMVIAIPTMIVLTRLLAWYFERLKKSKKKADPVLPEGGETEVKPFLSYAEYKAELTKDGSLEDFLARCRAGAVPKKPEPEDTQHTIARKKLAEIQKRIDGNKPSGGVLLHCNDCGRTRGATPDGTFPPCECWSEPS